MNTLGPQTIYLWWNSSSDAGAGVAGYHVYRDDELVADIIGNTASFFDRQLDGSRAYRYRVQAFDGSGMVSGLSAEVSATTTALPAAPVNYARCGAADGATGCSYTSTKPADATWYPDTNGTELTDGKHGGLIYGPEWQGRNAPGTYQFTIDLGATKTITEINTTWLQVRPDYTFLPPNLTYEVSNDGVNFRTVAVIDRPAIGSGIQAKTYRTISLNESARYVRATIDGGDAWTMLDEFEARGN
ncbi:discoidin domain-containing protein [Dactylosporangium sp. CA-152071]|uniref:discoidin domain-containing protein n=1 Tax=Dactylosporangium sp. CA-152071 TaxID=3239933 RepID=UPI003D8F6F99